MNPTGKIVSRRTALARLAGIGGLTAATHLGAFPSVETTGVALAQARFRPPDEEVPVQGKAGPGLEPFDKAMLAIMDRHGVPGAALALAKDGKLVLAKGYGWANVITGDAVEPDTLFGLASLSKSITTVATLLLIEQGKFGLDDPVFNLIKHIKPPRGAKVDPNIFDVSVRQCLIHSGGWDRRITGDPINWEPQICRALRLRPPISPQDFLSFILALPLNFKPGTDMQYSNVGSIILGEVIAKTSGQTYERFVEENVLKPMGIKRAALHPIEGKYLKGEAIRHLAGSLIPLPPMQSPMVDAAGGWSGSVVDMARFLTNIDGSRGESVLSDKTRKLMLEPPPKPLKPRENGAYFGLGWDTVSVNDKGFAYFKDGSTQGMRTFMKRLPNGVNWALLYNASMEFDHLDMEIAGSTIQEVRQLVERFEKYPDIDLFKEYP
jgi:CubicO group peptidase (beta-lactamase class C family)